MKFYLSAYLLLSSTISWGGPLLLKCTVNNQSMSLNVESLKSDGCKSKDIHILNGQIQTRYNVTLCANRSAYGTIDALGINGEWITVNEFSTEKGCRLFREIQTSYPCRPNRYAHNGGCLE